MRTLKCKNLYELKDTGHDIIDEIVDMGFDRSWVYTTLGRYLNFPGNWKQHFSQMNTEEELIKAILKLKQIRKKCLVIKENRNAVYTKNISKIRQVGKLNSKNIVKKNSLIFKLKK